MMFDIRKHYNPRPCCVFFTNKRTHDETYKRHFANFFKAHLNARYFHPDPLHQNRWTNCVGLLVNTNKGG
jgi:hypothetical protein